MLIVYYVCMYVIFHIDFINFYFEQLNKKYGTIVQDSNNWNDYDCFNEYSHYREFLQYNES